MTRIPYRREPPEPLNKVKDSAVRREFAAAFEFCWLCGLDSITLKRCHCWLEVDHIIGGAGRSDQRQNYCRLCNVCHARLHSMPKDIALGLRLWLKQCRDPDYYDPKRLAVLYGRPLPEPLGVY